MSREIKAIFRNGQVRPIERLDVPEDSRLRIIIDDTNGRGGSTTKGAGADSMASIYEIAEDIGPPDLATHLDHYLYGTPKAE